MHANRPILHSLDINELHMDTYGDQWNQSNFYASCVLDNFTSCLSPPHLHLRSLSECAIQKLKWYTLPGRGYAITMLAAKCIGICAMCHRKKHLEHDMHHTKRNKESPFNVELFVGLILHGHNMHDSCSFHHQELSFPAPPPGPPHTCRPVSNELMLHKVSSKRQLG